MQFQEVTYPSDGFYIMQKAATVQGVALKVGEYLPMDNPVRENQRKIEQLVKLKFLAPSAEPPVSLKMKKSDFKKGSKTPIKVAKKKDEGDGLDRWSLSKIKDYLRKRHKKLTGDHEELLARLRRTKAAEAEEEE